MAKELWELAAEEKVRDHDLHPSEIDQWDIANIKGIAIRNFVETRESDGTVLTIQAFMGYLTSKGFRITKVVK